MSCTSKKLACKFRKEYKINKLTASALSEILTKQGYTVVNFNSLYNEPDVAELINTLNLSDFVKERKGFTYADVNHRIVFVNEDLSEQEKLLVLLHEEGHIYCGHLSEKSIIGRDVIQEYEANEFVHYMLNETFFQKIKLALLRHKKATITMSIILVCAIVAGVITGIVIKQQSYYGEYYITKTGNKYHEEKCVFVKDKDNIERLTKEQFENREYEPCGTCLPGRQ